MAYFSKFTLEHYRLPNSVKNLFVDITKRSPVNPIFDRVDFFIEYVVQEGDTPIIIADKLYDDEDYAWTILHYNRIVDYYNEWPMEQYALDQHIRAKYTNPYDLSYYLSKSTGNIVNEDYPNYDKIMVTYYEDEVNKNDKKRIIKLIRTDFIEKYIKQHELNVSRL